MRKLTHQQLIKKVEDLENQEPSLGDSESWSKGEPFINFLQSNDLSSRLVLLATTRLQFMHSLIVDNSKLEAIDQDDLVNWSVSIPETAAGYCYDFSDPPSVRVCREIEGTRTKTLENSTPILFGRYFDGLLGPNKKYYEINQEITHASEVHWVEEKHAYCKIDHLGDIEEIINITQSWNKENNLSLITCEPEILEDYLFATNSSIVRLYIFQIPGGENLKMQKIHKDRIIRTHSTELFSKTYQVNELCFLRGVQIIRLHNSPETVARRIMGENIEKKYVEFTARDLRDGRIKKISTDPIATSNFYNMNQSDKPLELSPAFFRPEVLSKYKADPEKYTLSGRWLNCRNAWTLRDIDFTENGQIHAYICDLAAIPYEEQLYWLSCNEEPKSDISERAIRNDFLAQWYSIDRPIDQIKSILRRWESEKVGWWQRSASTEYAGFDYPLSENKKEWETHFLELAKLVIEGFKPKYLRKILDEKGVTFAEEEENKPIILLEKVLEAVTGSIEPVQLGGLREVQRLRTKLTAHVSGSEAKDITKKALSDHGSYENHFQKICENVNQELLRIETILVGLKKGTGASKQDRC